MESREVALVRTVDANDRPVGVLPRSELFKRRANFRVAHVFIVNREGELLLQRISPLRNRHRMMWGSSVAAYVLEHEDYEEAARRRMHEEAGVTVPFLQSLGKTMMNDEGCQKFIGLFECQYTGAIRPNPRDAAEMQYWSVPAIRTRLAGSARIFTPTFAHLFHYWLEATRRA